MQVLNKKLAIIDDLFFSTKEKIIMVNYSLISEMLYNFDKKMISDTAGKKQNLSSHLFLVFLFLF